MTSLFLYVNNELNYGDSERYPSRPL
jgi:hypothetical protein